MEVTRRQDMPHKIALYSLLDALLSNPVIATNIYFKGGTCASMLGFLDRFSIDLDFDILDKTQKPILRKAIHKIISQLGYTIKDESKEQLQFFLKYRDIPNERNNLKLEISDLVSTKNKYKEYYLVEIDKYCQAQTIETMFANKLVALKARWDEGKGISGRDMYDIHHFFKQGYDINTPVVEELRNCSFNKYVKELIDFITTTVSDKMLWEDLNPLVSSSKLKTVVPKIKSEVISALKIIQL
ncbi:nucleotidyl transferase AbiEii/AbiGii toxin family protein [Candidatus Dojkabacteria bacterium]|nr:nucleotidyl transferase AbiEii/AbiGii toxin family protein [Candidatus Dojkabacteria bacterium]